LPVYGCSDTSENLLKIGVYERTGSVWPKILGTRGRPHQAFACRKTRMIVLSCCARIWAEISFFLSQFTHLADEQTDGRLNDCRERVAYNAAR